MPLAVQFSRLGRALAILLSVSCMVSFLWILFTASLGIWWKIILIITLIGLSSIGMYLRNLWLQTRSDATSTVAIPQHLPPKPARKPAVGLDQEGVSMNKQSSPPHDSDLKYCERLKPVVMTCLITLVAILSFASLMLSLGAELNSVIGTGLFWLNGALWLYVAIRGYLWSKTYLIVTATRAILATITPFGVMKPNVLLKDASSQDVRQNIFDKWFGTGTLFLDTPSKKDTIWHHLRWVRYPDRLERALGLPTTKEINDAIQKDKNLRKIVKSEKRRG